MNINLSNQTASAMAAKAASETPPNTQAALWSQLSVLAAQQSKALAAGDMRAIESVNAAISRTIREAGNTIGTSPTKVQISMPPELRQQLEQNRDLATRLAAGATRRVDALVQAANVAPTPPSYDAGGNVQRNTGSRSLGVA
jgi:hypothetical protein